MRNKKLLGIISIFLALVIGLSQFGSALPLIAAGPGDSIQTTVYKPGDEIISDRTETAKKYYLGANSYALDVSLAAIHYKDNYTDNSEQWKDIDLSLDKNNRITKAPYELTVDTENYAITVKDKKTGQVTTLKLIKIGDQDIKDIKKTARIYKGKVEWNDVGPDLDLAITADNTIINFDWIVKSENAPHNVEFEIQDGGIPIVFSGLDADRQAVKVTAEKNDNKIVESIDRGGKYPKIINPTLDVQVGSEADNGYVDSFYGTYSVGYAPYVGLCWWQYYQTYYHLHSWYRWTGFTIPSGSTINSSSYVSLRSLADFLWAGAISTRVYFDDESSPSAPSSWSNYFSRPLTSNYPTWNISTWTADTWYNSPSIQNTIQELVNSYGSISVLQCLHKDNTTPTGPQNKWEASYGYGNSPGSAPKLHIEYTPPPPSAPANVSASDGSYDTKVYVTWTASSGATGYKVFQNTTNNSGTANQIGTSSSLSFDDTSASYAITYFYWVKAYNDGGDSTFSNPDTGWRAFTISATDGAYTDRVRVTWPEASGATSYKVYRNTVNSPPASPIGTVSDLYFDDISASSGNLYYYWVKAHYSSGDSGYSTYDTGWVAVAAPTSVQATDEVPVYKIQITWSGSYGATGYKVYRSTGTSPQEPPIGTTAIQGYDDYNAGYGTEYHYWVKAYDAQGDSAFSSPDTGKRQFSVATNVGASKWYTDRIELDWDNTNGATGYRIYRNTENQIPGSYYANSSTSDYDDTQADEQTRYWYWIQPICETYGLVLGPYSESSGDSIGWRLGDANVIELAAGTHNYNSSHTDYVFVQDQGVPIGWAYWFYNQTAEITAEQDGSGVGVSHLSVQDGEADPASLIYLDTHIYDAFGNGNYYYYFNYYSIVGTERDFSLDWYDDEEDFGVYIDQLLGDPTYELGTFWDSSFYAMPGALRSAPAIPSGEKFFWDHLTPEETLQLAGYAALIPDLVPNSSAYHVISVMKPGRGTLPPVIVQHWKIGNSELQLIQDPACTGIGNGKTSEFYGISGQQIHQEAEGKSPPVVGYFWVVGDMHYVLFATLSDALDEEAVGKIILGTLK